MSKRFEMLSAQGSLARCSDQMWQASRPLEEVMLGFEGNLWRTLGWDGEGVLLLILGVPGLSTAFPTRPQANSINCSLGVTVVLLSQRNGRFCERAFAYFTVEETKRYLSCTKTSISSSLIEEDTRPGPLAEDCNLFS